MLQWDRKQLKKFKVSKRMLLWLMILKSNERVVYRVITNDSLVLAVFNQLISSCLSVY